MTECRWCLVLGALTVLGLCLRVIGIEHNSFWYDEAVTAQMSQISVEALFRGTVKD
jgi:hypothetical protein